MGASLGHGDFFHAHGLSPSQGEGSPWERPWHAVSCTRLPGARVTTSRAPSGHQWSWPEIPGHWTINVLTVWQLHQPRAPLEKVLLSRRTISSCCNELSQAEGQVCRRNGSSSFKTPTWWTEASRRCHPCLRPRAFSTCKCSGAFSWPSLRGCTAVTTAAPSNTRTSTVGRHRCSERSTTSKSRKAVPA